MKKNIIDLLMFGLSLSTIFFTYFLVFLALSLGMTLAYFSIRKARYFLYWNFNTIFYLLALFSSFLFPAMGWGPGSLVSNILLYGSIATLIRGCGLFSGLRSVILQRILIVYSILFLAVYISIAIRVDNAQMRTIPLSFILSTGYALVSFILSKTKNLKDSPSLKTAIAANVIIACLWFTRGVLGFRFYSPDFNELSIANMVLPITGVFTVTMNIALIVLSQTRMWMRLLKTEHALEGATFRASATAVFAGLAHELGTPIGNIRMSLSQYGLEADSELKDSLVSIAYESADEAMNHLRKYRLFIDQHGTNTTVEISVREVLALIAEFGRQSQHLKNVQITLDGELLEKQPPQEREYVIPGLLLQGILPIMEISGYMNWIGGDPPTVKIGYSRSMDAGKLGEINLTGIRLPKGLKNLNQDTIASMDFLEGRRMLLFSVALNTIEEKLNGHVIFDGSGLGQIRILLPLNQPAEPSRKR